MISKTMLTVLLFLLPVMLNAQEMDQINIIPQPSEISISKGSFTLTDDVQIVYNSEDIAEIADYLNDLIFVSNWNGYSTDLNSVLPSSPYIFLNLEKEEQFKNDEAYRLSVTSDRVMLSAPTPAGIFYGVQTLRQLLPVEVEHSDPSLVPNNTKWTIPAVEIYDYPRFEYRGMHLDVARHFFPPEFVKKYIDLLAMYKFNRFHWHLTEDQGWRIEIKKYPKLTEIGARRDSTLIGNYGTGKYDDVPHGGFYTQEEVKEIVDYAQKRSITIIPEIEMPGHSSAALAAYPEFGCFEKEYYVQSTWGIFEDIYCPSEETFAFLEDVLDEVMKLFPSEYIHIGGDEAPKKQWEESEIAQKVIEREGLKDEHELQSYFIGRIEQYLNSKGRQIIGWDEIMEGGLAPKATVMSWRGEKGGIEAAKMGHDVIMTPTTTNYFDYYQADKETEPIAIGGFLPLEDVYDYEPVPDELSEKEAQFVLGAQGNVWTEYMHTGKKVEYMAFPRAIALSEVLWSDADKKDWFDFLKRLQESFKRLEILDVNYAEHYESEDEK
jgi:hexosaminidase